MTDDLDVARADLNALIREAHAATKDLKQAQKELGVVLRRADDIGGQLNNLMDAWEAKVKEFADSVIAEQIDVNVAPLIDAFIGELNKSMEGLMKAIRTRAGLYLDSAGLPEDLLQNNFVWPSERKE